MAIPSKAGAKKSPANVKTLANKPATNRPAKADKPVPVSIRTEIKKRSSVEVKTEPARTVKPSRKSPVTPERRLHYVENKRGLAASLDNLYQFYKKHSASELKIASAVSYPQILQLKACHEGLLKSLEAVRSKRIAEPTPTESNPLPIEGFNSFVKNWLTNEVIKENLPLKPFLAKRSPMFDPR